MQKSEQIDQLAAALAKCQSEMSFAIKDSENPHFKSRYADLSSVWNAIREPLSKNGLSVSQLIDTVDGKSILVSYLLHTSGQWLKSTIPIKVDRDNCQGYGSGITYFRRYALAALVGCVQDDDDGNGAMPDDKRKPKEKAVQNDDIKPDEIKKILELSKQCSDDFLSTVKKYMDKQDILDFESIKSSKMAQQFIQGMNNHIAARKKDV